MDIANVALRRVGAQRIDDLGENSVQARLTRDIIHAARRDLLTMHTWNFATRRTKLAELTSAPGFGFDNAFGLPDDLLRVVSVHPSDDNYASIRYKLEYMDDTTTNGSVTVVTYTGLSTETIKFEGTNIVTTTLTEGTDFDAETSNTVTGDNIVTAVGATATTGIIGISASNSAGVVTFTPASGYTLKTITLSDTTDTTRVNPVIKPQYALLTDSDTIYIRYVFDLQDVNIMSETFRDVFSLRLARDYAMNLAKDRKLAEALSIELKLKLGRAKSIDGIEDWPESRPSGSWVDSRFGGQRGFTINDG
jgi:hypothetical protein